MSSSPSTLMVRPVSLLLVAALVLGTACATGGARAKSPQMVGRSAPQIQFTGADGAEPLDIEISVLVRADGMADMSTFKVTGRGSVQHENALREWIERAHFRPAMLDGAPVDAVFKQKLAARVTVTRTTTRRM